MFLIVVFTMIKSLLPQFFHCLLASTHSLSNYENIKKKTQMSTTYLENPPLGGLLRMLAFLISSPPLVKSSKLVPSLRCILQSFKALLADDAVPMEISNMPVHYFQKSKICSVKIPGLLICCPKKQFCDICRELPSTMTLHGDTPCGKFTANRLKQSQNLHRSH